MRAHLFEQIMALRTAASAIYDRGRQAGHSQEDVQAAIEPVREALRQAIETAAGSDLPACILAIKMLEHQAKAHEEDMRYLREKADDALAHAGLLRRAISRRLGQAKKTVERDADYSATLSESGDLVLR